MFHTDLLKNVSSIWFIIGLIFLVSELFIPGLVIVFFGIGAWVVALLTLFIKIDVNLQLVIFLMTSIITLIFLRKFLLHHFYQPKKETTGANEVIREMIGERAVVEKTIAPHHPGTISFRGTQWEAEAARRIEKGTPVKITGNRSILLKVEPLTNTSE
jgi:inner membrane protein